MRYVVYFLIGFGITASKPAQELDTGQRAFVFAAWPALVAAYVVDEVHERKLERQAVDKSKSGD